MAEVTAFQAAAPFIVGGLFAVVGGLLSRLVEQQTEDAYWAQLRETEVAEKDVPVVLSPPELRTLAAWAVDTAQALVTIAAPATAMLLFFPQISSSVLIVAYTIVMVGGLGLFTWLYLHGPVGYLVRQWYGFSCVTWCGIIGNGVAGALAAAAVVAGAAS
jgi:hypothetical protein